MTRLKSRLILKHTHNNTAVRIEEEWKCPYAHLRLMIHPYTTLQVDPAKLNTLKDLINAPNYKENLGTLIKTIYEFAFLTYAGIQRNQTYSVLPARLHML